MMGKKSTKNSHDNAVLALTGYIQLVVQGLRDSYLVDHCNLTYEEIFETCKSIASFAFNPTVPSSNSSPSLSSSSIPNSSLLVSHSSVSVIIPKIIFIRLGQDVMIANPIILKQKLTLLKSNDWSTNHPFLINVDGSIPVTCTNSQVKVITSTLVGVLTHNQWLDSFNLEHQENDVLCGTVQSLGFTESHDFLTFVGYPFLAGDLA